MIKPCKIQIRYADLDPMGHVNNAVYLNYFEIARVYYFNKLLKDDWDWNKNGLLLVRNEVDYLLPLLLNDEPEIKISLLEIGNKSFKLKYDILVRREIHCTGLSVLVCYDSTTKKTIKVNDSFRKALLSLN